MATAQLSLGFRSIIENSPDAIFLLDRTGAILWGSAAAERLFGCPVSQFQGEEFLKRIHSDQYQRAICDFQEVLAHNRASPVRREYRMRTDDDQFRWVDSTMSNLLSDADVQAVVVYQRDIHSRLERTQELTNSNSRLEEFAYLAAHDLREPLRAISLYTEILSRNLQMDEQARQMSRFVLDGSKRMFTLIDDLLTYARTGVHEPARSVNLQRAAEQAVESLALVITSSGAKVKVDSLPVVSSNETNVVRLFQNLIENAVKYRRSAPVEIHISAEPQGSDWAIKIQDNGIGIAADHYTNVFKPFVRLNDETVRGSGLGLAVCKKIVEGMGGAISVKSEVGVGSTFMFTLVGKQYNEAR